MFKKVVKKAGGRVRENDDENNPPLASIDID
jgi:hypothetical protein